MHKNLSIQVRDHRVAQEAEAKAKAEAEAEVEVVLRRVEVVHRKVEVAHQKVEAVVLHQRVGPEASQKADLLVVPEVDRKTVQKVVLGAIPNRIQIDNIS